MAPLMAELCQKENKKIFKRMKTNNPYFSRRIKDLQAKAKASVATKSTEAKLKQLGMVLAEVAEVIAAVHASQLQCEKLLGRIER